MELWLKAASIGVLLSIMVDLGHAATSHHNLA
jgi:hypothetical protein